MAVGKYNLMKNVAELVQKAIECPVCLDVVRIPFKQCENGHNVCSECAQSLGECPLCNGSFTCENPKYEKSLLETLPKLCRYSENGCPEVFMKGVDPEHYHSNEAFCHYRTASCREQNCKVMLPLCNLVKHYLSNHPKNILVTEFQKENLGRFNVKIQGYDKILVFCSGPAQLWYRYFWIVFTNNTVKKQFEIRLETIIDVDAVECFDVKVRIDIGPGIREYTYCFQPTEVEALVDVEGNTEEESTKEECEGQFCMKVPHQALRWIYSVEDDTLQYYVTFDSWFGD